MARTRVDVWRATDDEGTWPEVLRAYEQAVGTMRGLDSPAGPPVDPLGWRFQAAIHGIAGPTGEPDTSNAFWSNCQHGSWFFLPWHRMYLAAFEQIIQFHLEDDTWSLPYWYSIDPDDARKAALPPAFLDLTLADNNLETVERSTLAKAGGPFYGDIDPDDVGRFVIEALQPQLFASPSGEATFGGGERADIRYDGGERGLLEDVPHGAVHSLVGNDYEGNVVVDPGWMGAFETAGLDPLFWLHHCNIDRLWEVWLALDPDHRNPTDDPAFVDTSFTFPAPGAGTVTWRIGDVLDTEFLGYVYESTDPPSALVPAGPPERVRERVRALSPEEAMPPQVLGATSDVPLSNTEPVPVSLARPGRERAMAPADADRGTRVFLRVEGITGSAAAPIYGVHVNVPPGEDAQQHPELRAGSFSTFGLVETSRTDDLHAAEGLTAVFEITELRDRLAADGQWDPDQVTVSFSTSAPTPPPGDTPRRSAAAARGPDLRARRVAVMVE